MPSSAEPKYRKIERKAKDTLTAVELDPGDELHFQLADGKVRVIRLLETSAHVFETNLPEPKAGFPEGVTRIWTVMKLEIDGLRVELTREVGSQRSFYEPRVVMGMRIWPDAVLDIFNHINDTHGGCAPGRQARLAVQDATLEDCPVLLHPWCPLPEGGLRIEDCYDGLDCWMGAYWGADAHGGLDINHPAGTPLWTPLPFDDHYLFDSLEKGANNNRWRGLCHWPNGATWILQSHHVVRLLVPEHQPLMAGQHYADAAGVLCGSHEHSHFVFAVEDYGQTIRLDPWILFWNMYRDRKRTSCL